MEVINESLQFENKEMLPDILMRIFSVCKADSNFPLKTRMVEMEKRMDSLNKKIERQEYIVKETMQMRDDLSNRLQTLRQENYEVKSRLLEELGSEI